MSGDMIVGILKGLAEGFKVISTIQGVDKKGSTDAITAKPSNTITDQQWDNAKRLRADRPKD